MILDYFDVYLLIFKGSMSLESFRARLIVNADDLGYCVSRDRGILDAARAGRATSASLIVTIDPDNAVKAMQQAQQIGY